VIAQYQYDGGVNIEIAGRVFQNQDGTWGYTVAWNAANTYHTSYPGGLPSGIGSPAIWHIHTGAPGTNVYNFSRPDMSYGQPNYLGTPNGMIQLYTPGQLLPSAIIRPPRW